MTTVLWVLGGFLAAAVAGTAFVFIALALCWVLYRAAEWVMDR